MRRTDYLDARNVGRALCQCHSIPGLSHALMTIRCAGWKDQHTSDGQLVLRTHPCVLLFQSVVTDCDTHSYSFSGRRSRA